MITPEEIFQKAENLYPEFLRTHLKGETGFFPRPIPCKKAIDAEAGMARAIEVVQALRKGSKEVLGYGYTVEWREVNSRRFGRNRFPDRITFESEEDLLRFIRKEREFQSIRAAASCIRARYPQLEAWVRSNPKALLEISEKVDGLLEVVAYLEQHPRPGCFVRELPISVDTKFVESHKAILQRWLDLVLPPNAIRSDDDHFERRYGLRYAEPLLLVRFLDDGTKALFGYPCEVLGLPLETVGKWCVRDVNVLIVENKVNLLTLPALPNTMAIGGLGAAVSLLRYCAWLSNANVLYWGDLDAEGLSILSMLRSYFPHTASIMMDVETLTTWGELCGEGTATDLSSPRHLSDAEREAFLVCVQRNLRLEQERLPQSYVVRALQERLGTGPASTVFGNSVFNGCHRD